MDNAEIDQDYEDELEDDFSVDWEAHKQRLNNSNKRMNKSGIVNASDKITENEAIMEKILN